LELRRFQTRQTFTGCWKSSSLWVAILPWDSSAARQYGALRAVLEREGLPMGNLDMMIASHALALGLILVTGDQAFRWVKKLKMEDWTKKGLT
jgi:tRNA(fMet)-specific endonuclease VapC